MAPAPTEEGDAIARVEEVLADLEEQAMLGAKRHSRSFSEPNLAAKVVKQQLQAAAKPAAQDQSSEEDDTFPSHRVGHRCPGCLVHGLPCWSPGLSATVAHSFRIFWYSTHV